MSYLNKPPFKSTPLSITSALTRIGKTWVSLPQGRQKEAEEIGGLIAENFKKK